MTERHEQLDSAMEHRRLELRLSWTQVARTAGISPQALRAIRRGEYKPSALTARAIEDALKWKYGSVDAVLDGGDPTPMDRHVGLNDTGSAADELDGERLDPTEARLRALEERLAATEAELRALRAESVADAPASHVNGGDNA